MTFARIRAILRGAGSLLDVCPDSADVYSKFAPKDTPEERLRKTFVRVGDHIHAAMQAHASHLKNDNPSEA